MNINLHTGQSPLLVSMPHIGTFIPSELQNNYVPRALAVEDTDWHLDQLYDFVSAFQASVLKPTVSRYVIDNNRPPDDTPMYPGASNTELCPTHFFTGDKLYKTACEPDSNEILRRRSMYWQPYHTALQAELQRIKNIHGYVLLWDAHSIRSQIPWLFEGVLPSMNIGTASGASADARITAAIEQVCKANGSTTYAINGRFKGGYTTRHYGDPKNDIHVVQLEKCQSLYMQEIAPYRYDADKARKIQPLIKEMMLSAINTCRAIYGK